MRLPFLRYNGGHSNADCRKCLRVIQALLDGESTEMLADAVW